MPAKRKIGQAIRKVSGKRGEKRVSRSGQSSHTAAIFIPAGRLPFYFWLGMPEMTGRAQTDFDYIRLGNTGIRKASLDTLAQHTGMTRKNIAEEIFDVSVKTLERKKATDRLDKKVSSHAIELARVLEHAGDVFEDYEKVKLWINRENKALNNMKPVDLFDTLTGLNMVNDILGRIEEGVYS